MAKNKYQKYKQELNDLKGQNDWKTVLQDWTENKKKTKTKFLMG